MPSSAMTAEPGIFTRIAPKPMGRRSAGSMSFLMARKISTPPMIHIATCGSVTCLSVSIKKSIKTSVLRFVFLFVDEFWKF